MAIRTTSGGSECIRTGTDAENNSIALAKRRQLAELAVSEAEYNRRGLYMEDEDVEGDDAKDDSADDDEAADDDTESREKVVESSAVGKEELAAKAGRAFSATDSGASSDSIDPRKAKLHKTGTRVYLMPCTGDESSSIRRYILCSGCTTAYVGNAVTAPTVVRCPNCQQKFSASPSSLYISVDADKINKQTKRKKEDAAVREARADEIVCKHFGACPGCTIDKRVDAPAVAKEAAAFARNALHALHALDVTMGSATQWRTHAKLAIRPDGMGLFKNRSHDVVEIPDCAVHHPAINAAAKALQKAMKDCGVRPYDEDRQMGRARYALFTVERKSGLVQVTIVWNASCWKDANPVAPRLGSEYWSKNRDILHSVWFNWNTSTGNAITSQKEDAYYLMHGPGLLVESVGNAKVYFAPTVFRQANLDAFEDLILPKLLSYVPKHSTLVELYGGVGVISLAALKRQSDLDLLSVTVTEINQFAAAPFKKSLAQFDRAVCDRVKYIVGSDTETVEMAVNEDADIVIIDPPRAGVSDECMEELANPPRDSPLKRLIYVSCGFDAFKRDSRQLLAGQWSVHRVHGYILFPGSNHIELLAVFDRRPS
jgi:23S rRNA (uracil1939-C5)-methyltransferase